MKSRLNDFYFRSFVLIRNIEEAKKFSAPERKNLKSDVRKGLESLISSSMARNIRDTKRPSLVIISPSHRPINKDVLAGLARPTLGRDSEDLTIQSSRHVSPEGGERDGSVHTTQWHLS